MRTAKPFSSITYNTKEYLTTKLEECRQKGAISFWAFIEHLPEKDEKKEHKHIYVVPERQIDTKIFMDFFTEIDIAKPLKPLKMMPCRASKWQDWYLYALHNTEYLRSKGQEREYTYTLEQINSSDNDYLLELAKTIDFSKFNKNANIVKKIKQGASLLDLVETGEIPISQFNQFKNLYDYVNSRKAETELLENYNIIRDNNQEITTILSKERKKQ